MEGLLLLAMLALVVLWFSGSKGSKTRRATAPKGEAVAQAKQAWLTEVAEWLPQRWERSAKELASGNLVEFQKWYFDDVTERQQARLADIKELGVFQTQGKLTKGQASDLIGLFEEPDDADLDVMKFFKLPTRGASQTKARMEVARLFMDSANRDAWEKRPPTALQKEFYHLFALPVPKGLTHDEMRADINVHLTKLDDEDADISEASDMWDAYENIYTELSDPEFRRDTDIKKVSLKVYREYMLKKKAAGVRLADLDEVQVADELLEERPELARS
jgi:hypothetical protein